MATTYWDPTPHIDPSSLSFTYGRWEERNPLNVPGPLYGAMTDTCWVGRLSAPHHFLYGSIPEDTGQEFLFRQPCNHDELHQVLEGIDHDPFLGWACDGDDHWTSSLVRDWWNGRSGVVAWISRALAHPDQPYTRTDDVLMGLREYFDYLHSSLRDDLAAYMFWLDQGRPPGPADVLPHLEPV